MGWGNTKQASTSGPISEEARRILGPPVQERLDTERDACAQIADTFPYAGEETGQLIADAIRNRKGKP